jgi:hypothetical protein
MKSLRSVGRPQYSRVLCTMFSWVAVAAFPVAALGLDQVELDTNRALWDSHGISDYDFILGIGCFCDPALTRPGLVSVRMGSIVSVVDAETLEPRSPADFLTVDALFDRLQFSLGIVDLQIDAGFDGVLGFPHLARFDDPLLGDDDQTYTIRSLTVVPEPAGLALWCAAAAALVGWRLPKRKS